MRRPLASFFVGLALAGCGGPIAGARQTLPLPAHFTAVARATTDDPDGLRVLWNGGADTSEHGAWIATTHAELEALWERVGAAGPVPEVDLRTHVVIGEAFMNGACMDEIVAVERDAEGRVLLRTEPLVEMCIALAVQDARVVAVPRSVLGERITWFSVDDDDGGAYAFRIPPPSPDASGTVSPGAPSTERDAIASALGTIALPARGTLALRALDDGREVWVAHLPDGRVHVVAADAVSTNDWLRHPVRWDAARGRFATEHDVTGRSVHGGVPLETHAFARVGEDRIAVGEVVSIAPRGTVEPRAAAPAIEGDAMPYASLPVIDQQTLEAVPEGFVARVGADLVTGLDGPPRLCMLPEDPKLRAHFEGCDDTSLALRDAPAEARRGISVVHGPLLVRRRGDTLDLAIADGAGESGWVVEHRIAEPAPAGPTRARGALALDVEASGDTRGAPDGFAIECVPAGGSPDESWSFVAPRDGSFAFELASDHDGAIAIVADDGSPLACNDDRHGHYRSSVAHATLAAGQQVRVIVDGFGGQAGAYRLRATETPALEREGVLALGVTVAGDTSRATDDLSAGCHAPAHDDAWRLEVSEPGRHRVRIEADGWHPLLAAYADGESIPATCGLGTGGGSREETYDLAAGTWWIVVDGAREEDVGAYRLTVERAD
ncbi:hypothetical protein [Sandaracinus amylolyticus]|uniref:Uncharacterized protein n=1 Tax=Sandaracinus amylolyticus TaxID=927083 RepID=A0A0F6YL93_9BACT|nr:hypothetical protein [Sandaracinus amylolyticus]AKF09616.1 hypothetical protein DB32_006765 [Sandaracinus amylolyticus]